MASSSSSSSRWAAASRSRMPDLKRVAQETIEIIIKGGYGEISFKTELDAAVAGTMVIRPDQSLALLYLDNKRSRDDAGEDRKMVIEVTKEKTQEAARRLLVDEKLPEVVLLNFASAKNRGGGFIRGAKAQEEDLCRASCLYECLTSDTADKYYSANARCKHLVYTDTMIYSPQVPFFRGQTLSIEPAPFLPSVITCPAPNAQALERPWPFDKATTYGDCFYERIGKVLAVAESKGHRNLVLGAWGCGVFGNSAEVVATYFHKWLTSARFVNSFDRVVFAIYDRHEENIEAFRNVFRA